MDATTDRVPKAGAFDAERFAAFCQFLGEGDTTREAAERAGLTRSCALAWADALPHAADQYARARERQADAHADQLMRDANEVLQAAREGRATHEWVQAARVAIDAKKWAASKLRPRVYGERIDVAASVVTASVAHVELAPELRGVLRALGRNYARGIDAPAIEGAASSGRELGSQGVVQTREAQLEGAPTPTRHRPPTGGGRRATGPHNARKPATSEIFQPPSEALRVTDAELVEPKKIPKRERVKKMSAKRRAKYEANRDAMLAARKALKPAKGRKK